MIRLTEKMYAPVMAQHRIPFIHEDLAKLADILITAGNALVVERNDKIVGVAAWLIVSHPCNLKCRIFQELLWCVESEVPTDALSLFRALEVRAKEERVDVIVLGSIGPENELPMRHIYERAGYTFLENHFSKSGEEL